MPPHTGRRGQNVTRWRASEVWSHGGRHSGPVGAQNGAAARAASPETAHTHTARSSSRAPRSTHTCRRVFSKASFTAAVAGKRPRHPWAGGWARKHGGAPGDARRLGGKAARSRNDTKGPRTPWQARKADPKGHVLNDSGKGTVTETVRRSRSPGRAPGGRLAVTPSGWRRDGGCVSAYVCPNPQAPQH